MNDTNDPLRSILVVSIFAAFLGGFFLLSVLMPTPTILSGERRYPARFPPLSVESVLSGAFMDRFDRFAADNFPFRDNFRGANSRMVFGIYRQFDKKGLYIDKHGIGEFNEINHSSFSQLTEKIETISEAMGGVNVYYAYIPDKSIYSTEELPGFDMDTLTQLMKEYPMPEDYCFIELTAALDADSFYSTDLHWNQVMLGAVLRKLELSMGIDVDLSNYAEVCFGEFEGVYSGQVALPTKPDSLRYLINPSLSAMYLNEKTMELEIGSVYNGEKFFDLDPYDFFLSGAQPLIILENAESTSDKELYLFRDSFSSSLAPLLASAYSKVYLIDLRYIDMRILSRYVSFKEGSDAIFLYSSLIINNSGILQVY